MDPGARVRARARARCPWLLLIVFSFLCLQSMADDHHDDASLLFIDSLTHPYLHSHQTNSMSAMEVGATVSILLGLAPPPMLSTTSSSKLNELLLPNPFDRPRHVFMLEIGLAQDSQEVVYPNDALFRSAIKSKVVRNAGSVEIELPDRGVSFFSLDGPDVTDKDLSDFASSFGGSYVSDNLESLNGELIIPLPSGFKMNLHMSKNADRKFASGLVYLIDNIKKVTEMTKDLSQSTLDYAELVGGYFEGVKALQEEYGSKDVAQQGMELLLTTVSKAVENLQERYEGEIVAIVLFSKTQSFLPQRMLDVTYISRPPLRLLEEVKTPSNVTAAAEVALVRLTLAWTTGIVLLIATFIGVYLLMNMAVTRDTLLYSNVKLD
ncbi:hypothetical protein SOVF_174520 [Spinacia oleracea]|uniref:DUF7794 domain-containing protein n=1 Tax=Spinacia oleracea TaxID=3562 RepID=A0A9R0HY58_SPIOL|nr:uncharacterized protein LOC110778743 [Spinacia oleracea]XP_021838999.2 uncharacterized protein LOC110778743 [Spinacia oleracea]KNA07138.1 hypothetical protein SOVF_174520 [Spinacia oleracea]